MSQTPPLTEEEKKAIAGLYQLRDSLNQAAGCLAYHVDHLQPLARGGLHHPSNLRLMTCRDNLSKGAKVGVVPSSTGADGDPPRPQALGGG